jgi:hypothetical protein
VPGGVVSDDYELLELLGKNQFYFIIQDLSWPSSVGKVKLLVVLSFEKRSTVHLKIRLLQRNKMVNILHYLLVMMRIRNDFKLLSEIRFKLPIRI